MGEMIQLSCACGYQSDELFLGSGMLQSPERVAAHCRHCRAIVAAIAAKRVRCPRCRRKPDILEPSPTAESDRAAPTETGSPRTYVCPQCEKPGLAISSIGMWD